MEPLDDKELKHFLNQWEAPGAPDGLKPRVIPNPAPWWQWLFKGSIRIPVPVGLAVVVLLALWLLLGRPPQPPIVQSPGSSTLADFQPVDQLEPKIERHDEKKPSEYK